MAVIAQHQTTTAIALKKVKTEKAAAEQNAAAALQQANQAQQAAEQMEALMECLVCMGPLTEGSIFRLECGSGCGRVVCSECKGYSQCPQCQSPVTARQPTYIG